jgi:hypothetical protein
MTSDLPTDRRRSERFDADGITVSLRPRGSLTAQSARAVDFNRHGIAVHTEQPLPKDRPVYLSLRCGELRLDNLVGVVHNCVRQGARFRSGIRFRPSSELQRDRRQVERLLESLEQRVVPVAGA